MSPAEIRARVAILRDVRESLGKGSQLICTQLRFRTPGDADLKAQLVREIEHQLAPHNCYEAWVTKDDSIAVPESSMGPYRAGRLKWLDLMIEAAERGEPVPPPPMP